MDDMMQQNMQQTQMQRTMAELSKIEHKSNGVFDEQQRLLMEQQYMTAMFQGSSRMRVFGIERTDFGKMEHVSSEGMRQYFEERREAQHIHQVEESGKKKKSRQQEDAIARSNAYLTGKLRTTAAATAGRIRESYERKKEEGASVDEQIATGTEFRELTRNANRNEDLQTEAIANLMLKRDALANKLKEKAPEDECSRAERKYDELLLEKTNDALDTWMAAGGITAKGKRLSEREKKSAAQHLPLAVESYEYYAKNREMVIGGFLMDQMKKTKSYQTEYRKLYDRDLQSSKETIGLDQPIAGIYKDDITTLRNIIAAGGVRYEEQKERINQVYQEYIEHSIAFSNLNLEFHAAISSAEDMQTQNYLSAWWDKHDYDSRQHELAMDAAMAYIKFLIQQKQPDPTLAVYIEQHWHTDAFNGQLDVSAKDLYADREGYADRINARIREIEANTNMDEATKGQAIFQLESALQNPQNIQSEKLIKYSPLERSYTSFLREKCQITDNDPNGGGYRDVARVLMPVYASEVAIDAEQVKKIKAGLYRFAVGIYLGDQKDEKGNVIEEKKNGSPCTVGERTSDIPLIVDGLQRAKTDMEAYVNNHAKQFQPSSLQEAFQNIDIMTGAYKKAQAMRDQCGLIVSSDLFTSLDKDIQTQIKDIWDFSSGLTDFTHDRSVLLNTAENFASMREMMGDENAHRTLSVLGASLNDFILRSKKLHSEKFENRGA